MRKHLICLIMFGWIVYWWHTTDGGWGFERYEAKEVEFLPGVCKVVLEDNRTMYLTGTIWAQKEEEAKEAKAWLH
ncbi:MAG: hypothetical protein JW919_04585 [Candidatus Omnitrophica bacterium]|nr:hypothetical protein [Candidatus Omnitrophota bacterium]